MNVQLFLVWTKESFWLRNGGSTNSTMFSSRRSAKCPVLKPRQRRLQVYCTHGQEGNLCLYKCFTNRGVATCTHGTHVRTRLHREVHLYLLFWERWKKSEKTKKERKKERKKHIHFDSSGGFRCPRRASSYDQIRKVSDKLDKLFALQNIAKLWGIGFTLVFGFKIYRHLTKSATFQFGFVCCICLNQGSFEKVVHKTDI